MTAARSRVLCLGLAALLAAGCASKMRPVEGQTAEQVERDKTECAVEARAAGRGEFGKWVLGPGIGWWPVDAALLGAGLLGGGVRYLVTHERAVGAITDACLIARGYTVPEPSR